MKASASFIDTTSTLLFAYRNLLIEMELMNDLWDFSLFYFSFNRSSKMSSLLFTEKEFRSYKNWAKISASEIDLSFFLKGLWLLYTLNTFWFKAY